MANTYNEYDANGSQNTFDYDFPYLKTTDVKVSVDGVLKQLTTDYTRPTVTRIQFNSDKIPANGAKVRVYRDTDESSTNATFYAGSAIKSQDLNDNFLQAIYIGEEGKEAGDDAWNKLEDSVDSTETWVSNNTKIGTTGAIDARVDSKIDTALTTDVVGGNKITVTDNSPGSGQITVAFTSGSLVDSDINASAAISGSKLQASSGSNAGSMSAANFSKLGGIETGATADQTAAEIRSLVESASDSHVFTTADHTKLDGIEIAATGDQTNAEIRAAVEAATDSNVFTDADHTKLNAIEAGATGDQTNAEIRAAVEAASDSNVFTDADHSKLNAIEASATADQTASEIKTLLQSDKLTSSEIATGALDGRYYTETESDARYFNVSTGDTIKDGDAFPDNDTTIATTAAINDRIIDLVDDVGGFVPIANETSFPNANPDVNNGAGTLVSIKALSSNLTSNGSGVATIANGTVGNSTVTITGLANSTTYNSGYGMIVETTTTLNTYTFHRQVPIATEVTTVAAKATEIGRLGTAAAVEDLGILGTTDVVADLAILGTTDVVADMNTLATSDVVSDMNTLAVTSVLNNMSTCATNVSNINNVGGSISNVNTVATNISNVNDFSDKYRVASSAPTSGLDTGDLYFDTTANELKVYNGSSWQGGVTATGNLAGLGANTFTGHQSLGDNNKVIFGAGTDLELYHDGTDSKIFNHTGTFKINSNDFLFKDKNEHDTFAKFIHDGAVELYYDGVKKFDTNSGGAQCYGNLLFQDGYALYLGNAYDLQIYHDGSNNLIRNTTGNLYIQVTGSNENALIAKANGAVELYYDNSKKLETQTHGVTVTDSDTSVQINMVNSSGTAGYLYGGGTTEFGLLDGQGHYTIKGIKDGSVELYYDNVKKFETTNGGAKVTGQLYTTDYIYIDNGADLWLEDNGKIQIGNGSDLQIYHDGSYSYIDNTHSGGLWIRGGTSTYQVGIQAKNSENSILCTGDGSVELYYDASKKFETLSTGWGVANTIEWHETQGSLDLYDNKKVSFGGSRDLQIYHTGSASYIKQDGTGDLFIRDGSSDRIRSRSAGQVELCYDDSKKLETTAAGVRIYNTSAADAELRITASEGRPSVIIMDADDADDNADIWRLKASDDGSYYLQNYASGSYETNIKANGNGNVELYYDASKKLETTASGITLDSQGATTTLQIDSDTESSIKFNDHGGSAKAYRIGTNISDNSGQLEIIDDTAGAERFRIATDGAATFAGTVSDSKGNLRSIPQNSTSTSTYTLVAADAGKHVYHASTGSITVPPDVFSVGDAITIINGHASGSFTILQGTGVTIWNSAVGAESGTRTLATKGMCTLIMSHTNSFFISGAGLS